MAPLEVLQLLIIVAARVVVPLEVVVGPPLEVVLSVVLVILPLEVVLASGLVFAQVVLVYGPSVPLCTVSLA